MAGTCPLFSVLLLAVAAGFGAAQPLDGDLIVSGIDSGHLVALVRPATGLWTTLYRNVASLTFLDTAGMVRHAEDNEDLVLAETRSQWGAKYSEIRGWLTRLDPVTLTTIRLIDFAGEASFALDHDGTWVAAGTHHRYLYPTGTTDSRLAGLRPPATTVYHQVATNEYFAAVAIDRDPGGPVYLLGTSFGGINSVASGCLYGADRHGVVTTILGTLACPFALELDPATGHFVYSGGGAVSLLDKQGAVVKQLAPVDAGAARVNLDGSVWLGAVDPSSRETVVVKLDIASGAVVGVVRLAGTGPSFGGVPRGLEVYGSRRLACNGAGAPGTRVDIRLASRRPGDAHKPYRLACSLARRPALDLGVGDRLGLAPDPLFLLSALGSVPEIFLDFAGTTDAAGQATAAVRIPASFPPNLGVTVFVGGVIYDGGGVRTVTNTHWFLLD
ncbi:MAG: hypothetical protein JXQ29_16950 [Planctomycetes bacterium]|nr:hypothetical protein [Planctomycetota bacterium]